MISGSLIANYWVISLMKVGGVKNHDFFQNFFYHILDRVVIFEALPNILVGKRENAGNLRF